MKTFTKRTKGTMIALLLCFAFICGMFILFSNSSITAFANEETDTLEYSHLCDEIENCEGHEHEYESHFEQIEVSADSVPGTGIDVASGFGCNGSCSGASREGGYSSNYLNDCRNWQVMPIIGPMFKYWIDESTLSSLTTTKRAQFIADVDGAAAEWNSVRINDCTGVIVNLQKMSSNGIDVVPIRYNPSLSGASGKFNPIPLFHWIEIKYADNSTYSTILHEFGHMIGLQDLDMNNDPSTHISLMGYAGDDTMHYQDIQGLAVANGKHTNHDFRRYAILQGQYDSRVAHFCFYCDIRNLQLNPISGSAHFAEASTCLHTYQRVVSVGDRYWQKCLKCYKVIESEFTVSVKGTNSVEITGLIDNRATITIPRQIGGQNVTHIGSDAFSGRTNITSVTFQATSNITTIGNDAFASCTQLTQITIPASVTSIGDSAFAKCGSLTSVTIPSSVAYVGERAIEGSSSLIIYAEAAAQPSEWAGNWNPSNHLVYWGYNGSYFGTYATVSGDYDGDGKDDIAAFYGQGKETRIQVWLSTGSSFIYQGKDGWYTNDSYYASLITGRVVSGDYDGDGKDDIAAVYDYGDEVIAIHVWISIGDSFVYQGNGGWFATERYYASLITSRVVSGDFN